MCHSIGTDGVENSIKVHLSLCVPTQSTKIEGGGKEFSIADLWLSPILFSEFPSISPTASKKMIDRTPRATEKKQLSAHFSLRMVEFVSFYVILFSGAECVCAFANVSRSLVFSLMFFPSPSPLSHCHVCALSLSVLPSILSFRLGPSNFYVTYQKRMLFKRSISCEYRFDDAVT